MLPVQCEPPILWLGLAGFDAQQRAALAQRMQQTTGGPLWRISEFSDADAWLINGARVVLGSNALLRVRPGLPTERSVQLDLADVNRPVAFAAPLPEGFEPLCQFDPAAPASMAAMLAQLSTWLAPRQAQFALGREIVTRGVALRHGVFHVLAGGTLLAVLNFRNGRACFAPHLQAHQLAGAQWMRRPPAAADFPPQFRQTTVAQLSWTYVRHTDKPLLPGRYHQGKIFFRGSPKVPSHWLSDSQLLLLRELNAEAGTMQDLRQRTGLPLEQMARDLSSLYFASAITTTPSKAARPAFSAQPAPASSIDRFAELMRATEAPEPVGIRYPMGLSRQYATVPAPLMARA